MHEKMRSSVSPPNRDIQSAAGVFRELFDLAPTPHAVFAKDGQLLLANRSCLTQLALEDERDGETAPMFAEHFQPTSQAHKFLSLLSERQVIRRHEARMISAEGRVFFALVSGRTLEFEGRAAFEISFIDISKQKKLESALRREHARLYSLVDNLTAGLFLVNTAGEITDVNLWLAELLGLDQAKWPGQDFEEIFAQLVSQVADPEIFKQTLDQAVKKATEKPTIAFTLAHEKPMHLELTLFPAWDEDGVAFGWGGLVQDVTELRDQISWRLELLSILAHDLRTPLATVKGHATALLANYQRWGPEMVNEFLESIDRGVDDLVHQVDQSLALTRVETGRLGLQPEAVSPAAVIHQSLERAAAVLEDTPIELDFAEPLPDVRVDPARVEEVLTNLLENAARYSAAGSPVTIRAAPSAGMLQISVVDNGPGVPEAQQTFIFEKHARLDAEGGGTGLGLFISRKIVEAHGGRIWVRSPWSEGRPGAAFEFTLPLMPAILPGTVPEKFEPAAGLEPDGPSLKVLVVEDDPEMQALLRALLVEDGYKVEVASDGPSALDLIQAAPPDVVLLDWVLPGLSGLTVCRNIRRWSDVPIMMVTSKTAQEELVAALDAGADDYVLKPFLGSEVLARVRALLRRGENLVLADTPDRFNAGGLVIDFETRQAWMRGSQVHLTRSEYDLLAYMARNPRRVLTYRQLIDAVWSARGEVTRQGLFVHVSRLRKKIEPDPGEPDFIVTRWGVGYVFMPGPD